MPFLQIDSKKFNHNFQTLKQRISPNDASKIAIVLKDNAYGHGLKEIASLAHNQKITTAFVKNTKEALEVANFFSSITILYPNSLPNESFFKECIDSKNIYFCVGSLDFLNTLPKNTQIELKINSGMNRNGIQRAQLHKVFSIIKQKQLNLIGIFTHNGFGDDFGVEFFTQNKNFLEIKKEALKLCNEFSIPKPRFHSLSTSGALRKQEDNLLQELQDNLYRIGIGFYGYLCTNSKLSINIPLQPIASLFANKISTLKLPKHSRIGYGGASKITQDSFVSTYDIGYGDGLFRLRENMHLHTKEGFKILPRISMDCLSIESDKDCVCLFDDVSEWSKAFHTIPYEILSHLHSYIPKKII